MNKTLHSPDGTWWNLKGPDVPLDRATVVTKKVRKYTYENTFYTVLACASINEPENIFYQLEISRLIGTESETTEKRDFSIAKKLLREFPIPTEGYEIAEEKLKKRVDKTMLEILENKIKSLEAGTTEVSIPCRKPLKKDKKEKQKRQRKSKQDKKTVTDSQVQQCTEQRIKTDKDIRKREASLEQTEVIHEITESKYYGTNDIGKGMATGQSPVPFEEIRHDFALVSNPTVYFESEMGEREVHKVQEPRERPLVISTFDTAAIQKFVDMALSFYQQQHSYLKMKLVGNKDNALVNIDDRKKENMFGFHIEVNLDTLCVVFDTINVHMTLVTQLDNFNRINDIVSVIFAMRRNKANIHHTLLPVTYRDQRLQPLMISPGETECCAGNIERPVGNVGVNECVVVELNSDEDVTDINHDDKLNNEEDDDDEFIAGIMGIYCRSSIHTYYSEKKLVMLTT
ncbi:hypothetical protein ACF0H5_001369 [Mactra antiquata]